MMRGIINAIRLPSYRQNLPYTRDYIHYVYRLKTPLSRITQAPRNPSRYALDYRYREYGPNAGRRIWDTFPHAESSASLTNRLRSTWAFPNFMED